MPAVYFAPQTTTPGSRRPETAEEKTWGGQATTGFPGTPGTAAPGRGSPWLWRLRAGALWGRVLRENRGDGETDWVLFTPAALRGWSARAIHASCSRTREKPQRCLFVFHPSLLTTIDQHIRTR